MLTSAKVRVFNCGSVFAVTMQVEPRRVVIIQSTNQEILALLPTPRPDAVASRHISGARPRSMTPFCFLMCSVIACKSSRCQDRGPFMLHSGVLAFPQG